MQKLQNIRLFLLDMDGTFYLGDKLLPGSARFVAEMEKSEKEFVFLTNNSSKSRKDYLKKLSHMGFDFSLDRVMTSGEATIRYLKKDGDMPTVYLVGTENLQQEFSEAGLTLTDQMPDVAVLGFDTGLTYEKLWKLCDFVRQGIPFIATHPDFNCPIAGGVMPDIGGMIAFVKACTKKAPDVIIGKPNRFIVEAAAQKFNIPLSQIAMVGDRLYTDIAIGKEAGITSVLVLCGETKQADLLHSDIQPDYQFENLGALADAIFGKENGDEN